MKISGKQKQAAGFEKSIVSKSRRQALKNPSELLSSTSSKSALSLVISCIVGEKGK